MNAVLVLLSLMALFLIAIIINGLRLQYISPIYEKRAELLAKSNTLYKCHKCRRYQRDWQIRLNLASINEEDRNTNQTCVHCGYSWRNAYDQYVQRHGGCGPHATIEALYKFSTTRKDKPNWRDTHPDCPKLTTKKEYDNYVESVAQYRKMYAEEAEIEAWTEYQAKGASDWISRLGKTKEDV